MKIAGWVQSHEIPPRLWSMSLNLAPRVYCTSMTMICAAIPSRNLTEALIVIDLKKIEEIVENIARGLPQGTEQVRNEIRDNIRVALESALARMNLVTREEFDAQTLVLRRTREKFDELERVIIAMEERVD